MDLNIRQIRAFVTVARLGSFTRAAAHLHLSQPALTVQIRNLELTLGSRLLDRDSRGVEITRIGRELLPRLQKSLSDMEHLLIDARAAGGTSAGTVRIACLPSFASGLLPDLIREARAVEPGLRFVVKDVVAIAVNAQVRTEEVDIGLTGGDFSDPEFDIVYAGSDQLCLVYPKDHEIGLKRRIVMKDLIDMPLVLTTQGTSIREVVDAAFERLGKAPALSCEPTYMMTAVAMVKAGLGLTILPRSAREIAAEPDLIARPIDDSTLVRSVAIIKKRGRTLPAASAAFLTRCVAALRASESIRGGT